MHKFIASLLFFLLLTLFITDAKATTQHEFQQLLEAVEQEQTQQNKLDRLNTFSPNQESASIEQRLHYWFLKGFALDNLGLIEDAIKAYSNAISFEAQVASNNKHLILSYIERSYLKYVQTNDKAIYCPDRQKAYEYAQGLIPNETKVKAYVHYSFCFEEQKEKAIELLDQAIEMTKIADISPNQQAMIYNAAGNVYRSNHVLDIAYDYLVKAYEQWASVDDYADMFNMQFSIASLSSELGKVDQALNHHRILANLAKQHPEFSDFQFFTDYIEGVIAYNAQKFPQAIIGFNKALALKQTTQEVFFVKRAYEYLTLSEFRASKFKDSETTLNEYIANYPGEEITERLIIALQKFFQAQNQEAMQTLFDVVDSVEISRQDFTQKAMAVTALRFDSNIAQLDNQILKQQLDIQTLKLEKTKFEQQLTQLAIVCFCALLIIALFFIRHLIITRKRILKRSNTDYLTGIANRRYCFEQSARLLKTNKSLNQPTSLIIFDIDHFKNINDSFGHDIGDIAIKRVVAKTQQCLRSKDLFGRIGGEEFMLLLSGLTAEQANNVAERIRQNIETAYVEQDTEVINLNVSLGVVECANDEALKSAIKRADKALYQAKNNGRNQVVCA